VRGPAVLLVPLLVCAGLVATADGVVEVVREVPAVAVSTSRTTVSPPSHRPLSLRIPALGITSAIMDLGLTAAGTLQVPPAGFPAGWYTGSPAPGDPGPAVLAGHVDWAGRPGVFADLHRLVAHDQVVITRSDGPTSVFEVTRVERVAKGTFPTAEVYGDLDHPGLRLITCGGSFDRTAHSYQDNVIVFADLVPPRS
jgi:sortase (surface protein transpeptidase)